MNVPYHCAECGIGASWRITRRGDGLVSWACHQHLALVCDGLQRDAEVTELVVVLVTKWVEWRMIGDRLDQIADEPPPLP